MSEMTDIMAKKIFLDVCRGIESLFADLYHYYGDLYQDDPEASRLWHKTALEEESHQRQIELALRLWDETEFEVFNDCLTRAHAIHFKLLKLIDYVKDFPPDLLTAVTKAIEMEEKLEDMHTFTSMKFKEESMQKLFMALGKADRGHITDLQRYRSILYLPLSEMEG